MLTQYHDHQGPDRRPLVSGLDHSFASLGEATISTTIPISQQLPVKFDLPVKFVLPLSQDTTVTTVTPTPINTTVNLSLGQFGRINAPVSLNLPTGTQLRDTTEPEHPGEHDRGGEPIASRSSLTSPLRSSSVHRA